MFPSKTILRFRASPESHPYVAVVLAEGGNVLEVKRGGVAKREIYSSVIDWLHSIPEHPTMEQLDVQSNKDDVDDTEDEKVEVQEKGVEEKKKKEQKEKKEKVIKEKKAKLNLIPTSLRNPAVQWTYHIHSLIKEARSDLLKSQPVILAFNHLVDVLLKHNQHTYSFVPQRCMKYITGIHVTDVKSLKEICEVRTNSVIHQPDTGRYIIRSNYSFSKHSAVENKELEEAICREILEAYGALFDLIKDDLVPYVTRRQKETLTKKNAKDMIRLSERMELTQSVYEKELKRRQQLLERFTQNHEKQMERLRESMVRLMITEKQ